MRHLGRCIGDQRGGQRHQPIAVARQSAAAAAEDQEPHRAAHQHAHAQARQQLPDHVNAEPFAEGRCAPQSTGGDQDREVDEREGERIVEARLRGQAEAHLVAVALAGRPDLDVGRQHRVGGRHRGAEQQCHRQRESQAHHAQPRGGGDGQRHRDRQQPPGGAPAPPAQRPIQLQARAHQADDHHQFGHAFGQRVPRARAGIQAEDTRAEQQDAEPHADDRQGHRQWRALQAKRCPRGQQDHAADAEQEGDVGIDLHQCVVVVLAPRSAKST